MRLGYTKEIKVTKQDIENGKPTTEGCPIALALIRELQMEDDEEISVDGDVITVGQLSFDTPARAADFVERFDNEDKVKPFKFVIKL
jgi:hypothetical protein